MVTTALAPTNIAILKYWGKNPAYEELLIPTKSSLSFTVADLNTRTTTEARQGNGRIGFSLNGKDMAEGTKEHEYVRDFMGKIARFHPFVKNYDYRIASENNFPTAAGFASSASGFAALVKSLSGELPEFSGVKNDDKKLSALARLGSGSATRSIPSEGGFVEWRRGENYPISERKDAEEVTFGSYAETLFSPSHWPELRIIYVMVREHEKKIKSRAGMKATVETNPLYRAWVDYEEKTLKGRMIDAMRKKDFPELAEMIMKASNNLHQICLGTYPPIVYLDRTSLEVMDAVHGMNEETAMAAYTFDAGPNAVVFTLEKDLDEVRSALADIVGKEGLRITGMAKGAAFGENHLF